MSDESAKASGLAPPAQTNAIQSTVAGVVKGAVGSIPIFGSFGAEALDLLVTIPAQQRQRDFWIAVCEAIEDLRHRMQIDWESLETDQSFSATVSVVAQAVSRTANAKKLQLLHDAAVSSAMPDRPAEPLRHRFVRAVDELEPEHIALLSGFVDRTPEGAIHTTRDCVRTLRDRFSPGDKEITSPWTKRWCEWLPAPPRDFPEPVGWVVLLLSDLQRHGFVNRSLSNREDFMRDAEPPGIFSPSEEYDWRRTPLGTAFVNFVRFPQEQTEGPEGDVAK